MSSIETGRVAHRGQWAVFLILFLALALVCDRGFDLTDESYYVFWAFYPERFQASIHPFGLLLNAVTHLIGRSIIALRLFGLALLAGCGIILGTYADQYYRRVAGHPLRFNPPALAAIFALGNYAVISLLTPSYNLLANAAGSLILAGALGWAIRDAEPITKRLDAAIPSIIVGIGGVLAFFAKPTFAALAGLAILCHLALAWRRRGASVALYRAVVTGVACILPLVLVISATIGLERFAETIRLGLATLKFGNGLTALPHKTIAELIHAPLPLLLAGLALVVVVGWKICNPRMSPPRWASIATAGSGVLALCYLGVSLGRMVLGGQIAFNVIASPVLILAIVWTIFGVARGIPSAAGWRRWWPVAALLVLPFAIAFGTANLLIQQTSASLYAPLFAAAIAADIMFKRRIAAMIQAAAVAGTLLLLLWSFHVPYGLPASIRAQVEPLRILPGGDVLYVDRTTYRYVSGMRDIARRHGLAPDTAIIDLSGGGPGTALILNGKAPYYPWIVHIFGMNSMRLADTVWASLSPLQQRKAWIILPADPAFAGSRVLSDIRKDGHYRLLGRVPMTFWGRDRRIEIWARPDRAGEPGTHLRQDPGA